MEFISDQEIEIAKLDVYPEKLNYHCIWFGRKGIENHLVSLKSLFKTQRNPSVILWTDIPSYIYLLGLKEQFADHDFRIVIGSNTWKDCKYYESITFRSDYWRLQILEKFGGIYFDLDILFLKDISWFANFKTPIVQEGYTAEKVFNNALMFFPARHPGLKHWLDKIGTTFLGWKHVFEIQHWDDPNFGASLIPNKYTDRGWTPLGPPYADFFDNVGGFKGNELLDSESFVYHWHNQYEKSFDVPNTLANFSKLFVDKK